MTTNPLTAVIGFFYGAAVLISFLKPFGNTQTNRLLAIGICVLGFVSLSIACRFMTGAFFPGLGPHTPLVDAEREDSKRRSWQFLIISGCVLFGAIALLIVFF